MALTINVPSALLGAALCASCLLAGGAGEAGGPAQRVYRAQEFVLVNDAGAEVGRLSASRAEANGGAGLVLYSKDGTAVAEVGVVEAAGGLAMLSLNSRSSSMSAMAGQTGVSMHSFYEDTSGLSFVAEEGRVEFSVRQLEEASLELEPRLKVGFGEIQGAVTLAVIGQDARVYKEGPEGRQAVRFE